MNPTDLLIWLDWLEEVEGVNTLHLRRKVNKRGGKFRSGRGASRDYREYGMESVIGRMSGNGNGNGMGWGSPGFGGGRGCGNGSGSSWRGSFTGNGLGYPAL